MNRKSAGILLYRIHNKIPEVMLVHPGGPVWKNKDLGAWSIPKGEYDEEEAPLDAALRELHEETGVQIKQSKCIPLTPIKQKSGKQVLAWAMKGDLDTDHIKSNLFEFEWPPKSGKKQSFPEVDKAAWFTFPEAKEKINPAQVALLDELDAMLKDNR
jgi:predicted NUDIX family NTP pyrophosphohydrolase